MKPDKVHEHDAEWASALIDTLPMELKIGICQKYTAAFEAAYNNETESHKKSNKGRREANTRLRVFINKFTEANKDVEWNFRR